MNNRMHCIDCGYDLVQLQSRVCPECGRAFDPVNSETYLSENGDRLPRGVWFIVSLQAVVVVLLVASFIVPFLLDTFDLNEAMYIVAFLGITALPLQIFLIFCGVCMAAFETRSVVRTKRRWFLLIVLMPCWLVIGLVGVGVLLDYWF